MKASLGLAFMLLTGACAQNASDDPELGAEVVGKQDTTVALLFGNLRFDQYPLIGLFGVEMRDALNDYRTRMSNTWFTYYVTSPDSLAQTHMFLVGDTFYTTSQTNVGGIGKTSLRDWVNDYLNGTNVLQVGP